MTADNAHYGRTESERHAALKNYAIIGAPPEAECDAIVRLAAAFSHTPMAALTLAAEGRQWVKAEIGLGMREMPDSAAMCGRMLPASEVLGVPDADNILPH